MAGVLGLAFFGLYLRTLCPTVFWYDSAEYAAAALTLGIPHPPGYPLYTLIGHLFTWLPLEPARAVNVMSAFFGAVGVALCLAVARGLGATLLGSAVAAASLGASLLFWSQSVVAEVYTAGAAVLLGVLALVLAGLRRNRPGLLVLAALTAGLGLGVHLLIATCGVGLALLVWSVGASKQGWSTLTAMVRREGVGQRLGVSALCLLAVAAGSAIFFYLPWRVSMQPAVMFDDPPNWENFIWFVSGGNYKNWFWNEVPWLQRMGEIFGLFYDELLPVGLALAVLGLYRLLRQRPVYALALVLMIGGNIAFFFRYGVHDVEVFFIPSLALLCCALGLGVDTLLGALPCVMPEGTRSKLIQRGLAVALALYPVSLMAANYTKVDLSGYTAARDYAEKMCEQLPRGAVIINTTRPAEFKNSAVFEIYYQKALGRRPDVDVRVRTRPAEIRAWLEQGVPLYMFFPVAHMAAQFEIEPAGVAYRITRARAQPIRLRAPR